MGSHNAAVDIQSKHGVQSWVCLLQQCLVSAQSRHAHVYITKLSKLLDATCVFCFCTLFVVSKPAEVLRIVSLQATNAALACAGNSADVDGGAVAMDGCQCGTGVTVHHSVNFTNNTAARQGGAVYVNGLFNMTVVFQTVLFHENTVSAICCWLTCCCGERWCADTVKPVVPHQVPCQAAHWSHDAMTPMT